ncbi:TolC family protein [Marinobacter lacisalsi]|uniref:TolC family protein n=1 Tax=Marinobacter lacisalsi TaxID=475979 RepID=A0ABV8QKS8_9GAMM
MFSKKILVACISFAVAGCSVSPEQISQQEVSRVVDSDVSQLSEHPPVTRPVTLEDAIARGLLNNRDKQLKALEAALAQGQISLVRHEMLPSLTASAGYSRRDEYAASASVNFTDGEPDALGSDPSYSISQERERYTSDVTFSWNVLDFGLSYVRAKQHADRYLIAKERERKVVHNISQDVRAAYWRAVSAERLLVKINPLIDQVNEALGQSREVESRQLRSPLEALYYQRELLDILRALQSIRQDLMGARTELASLMGLRPGTAFELADVEAPSFEVPAFQLQLERMEELALNQRPELKETHYQKRISAADTRAALIDMLPGINLTAGIYQDSNDYLLNQDWTSVGAQVSWNLLDVFKYGAERDLAETREALAEQRRLATSMAVLTQVHLSRIRYQQAVKTFDLSDDYLQVARRIGEHTENSARAQRSSKLDLIRESLNTVLAELRRDVAYAEVQNSYGRLFVTIGMDLVPEAYNGLSIDELSQQVGTRFEDWKSGQMTPVPEAPLPESGAEKGV